MTQSPKLDASLSHMLLKVVKQDPQNSMLLQYLITNVDKASEDFASICELKYLSPQSHSTQSDLEHLSRALSQDLRAKARYYLQK